MSRACPFLNLNKTLRRLLLFVVGIILYLKLKLNFGFSRCFYWRHFLHFLTISTLTSFNPRSPTNWPLLTDCNTRHDDLMSDTGFRWIRLPGCWKFVFETDVPKTFFRVGRPETISILQKTSAFDSVDGLLLPGNHFIAREKMAMKKHDTLSGCSFFGIGYWV